MPVIGEKTMNFYPWFEDSGEDLAFDMGSAQHNYGTCVNADLLAGQGLQFLHNLEAGTYDYLDVGKRTTNSGVVSVSNNGGASQGSYSKEGATAYNQRFTLTGLSLATGTLQLSFGQGTDAGDYASHSNFISVVKTD